MRLIDADALVCSFCNVEGTAPILGLSRIIEVSDVVRIIEDAPTVDVVPVRKGRWIENYDMFKCSECGATGFFEEDYSKPYRCNFCPDCGADMREAKKNG